MIHKHLFEQIGRFDENFRYPHLEDIDLHYRLRERSETIKFLVNAIVDHPPKKLPWGAKLGAYHENDIYYWAKNPEYEVSPQNMIFYILKGRLRAIKSHPINFDSLRAILSLIIELLFCIFKLYDWKRKYLNYY
jgi:GT2 family glycosyltransferase